MIQLRKSNERGHADHGWLNTYHSFSFADYQDEKFMGFRDLRVINEDVVQPSQGFGTHGHRDMEIVTYVLSGALEHKDSMGNGSVIRPGDLQYMSAGSGVTHSEFNHSKSEPVHLMQIWIIPDKKGYTPRYDQKNFAVADNHGTFCLLASPQGDQGSIAIRQDVKLFAAVIDKQKPMEYGLSAQRFGWVQTVRGSVSVNDKTLQVGDGAAITQETKLKISALTDGSEFLFFDLC